MRGITERCKCCNKWIGGSTTISNTKEVKEIKLPLLQKHVVSSPPSINLKINSGATHHFQEIGNIDLPQQPTSKYNPAVQVIVPNIVSMVSSETTNLPIPSLLQYSTKSHRFNHMASGYLFSVQQACNHNWTEVFDNNSIKILKSTEVNITVLFPPIIQGRRNAPSQPLYSESLSTHPPSIYKSNTTKNVS